MPALRRLKCAAMAAVAAAFFLAAPANAQQSHVFQFALQNGMQVVVVPDHRAPVVTQMLWFRVGAVDDPPGLSGMAHFFEHMMFRGTPTVKGDQFAQTVARNGGESNAFTTHDYTAFYEQIAKDRLPLVMNLEADRMANLDLSDPNVNTERSVVLEERRMRVDNDPQAMMREQMDAALALSHPYGRPVIGWPEEVHHIGRREAQEFYEHHYAPNNAILIIAGDVTRDEAQADSATAYNKVSARPITPRWEFAQPPRLGETRLAIQRPDVKVPLFMRFYRVVSYTEAKPGEAEALETLGQILGGDETGALYRELVVKRRLATNAGVDYDGYARDNGVFSVYAIPRPGVRLDQLEHAVDQILAFYAKKPPAPPELKRAKTQLVADAMYQRDSQYELASAYGQALAIGLTTNDVDSWPDRIRAVDAASVRDAAARDLIPREAVTGYLEPGNPK